jgi:hypothetical protein
MAKIACDLSATKAFKARYGAAINQELKYATSDKGRLATWWQKFIDYGMKGMIAMDKVGVYALAGVYKCQREALENAGRRGEEASELAASWLMHIVDKTAQSSRTINTTQLQRAGGAWNAILQFKSSPIQQTQFEIVAFQEWAATGYGMNEKGKKVAAAILINHIFLPMITTAVQTMMLYLTSWGEPEDEKRKKLIAIFIANAISGSWGSVVFTGCLIEGVASALANSMITGEKPSLARDFRGFIPAEGAVSQWLRTGDKALKCLLECTQKDILDTAIELADALAQLNWVGRTASKTIKSANKDK